ncbi:MAG: peptidoglycan bridge formation glycyltransferase FemA/FemB family protein [Anaerolineales bacterium]
MPEVDFDAWKRFVAAHPNAHVLQTAEWGELKAGFGWEYLRIVTKEMGAQILFRKLPLGFTLAYMPKPVFSLSPLGGEQLSVSSLSPQGGERFWGEVDAACRKKRAVFLKIEPDQWENSVPSSVIGSQALNTEHWSLKTSLHNIQPPRTVILSLEGSETDILNRMKQKCRYNVRLAEKKGVTVRAWDDLEGFHRLMQVTGGRDGFGVHSLDYYRKAYELFHPAGMAELLVAEFEGQPLAALMIFAVGTRSWYLYGASNDEERNRMPTYLLQWEAMRWAKARGCAEYDLWGVPDADEATLEAEFETRHDGLWGVYRFKRSFGGEVKRASQALDRVYMPWLYRLYLWRFAGRE